jgi:hypothetical protein
MLEAEIKKQGVRLRIGETDGVGRSGYDLQSSTTIYTPA